MVVCVGHKNKKGQTVNDAIRESRQSVLDFFRIDEKVIHRVRALKPRILSWAGEAMKTAFSHVEMEPEVADYFLLQENMRALQASMLSQADRLLSAQFDEAYYQAIDEIGARHAKLDYPAFVYTAGYANLLSAIQSVAAKKRNALRPEDMDALIRVSLFDLENTTEAFYRHRLSRTAALDADAAKVRELLAKRAS